MNIQNYMFIYIAENPISLSSARSTASLLFSWPRLHHIATSLFFACSAQSILYWLPYSGGKPYQFLLRLLRSITSALLAMTILSSARPPHQSFTCSPSLARTPCSFFSTRSAPILPHWLPFPSSIAYRFLTRLLHPNATNLDWLAFPGHKIYQLLLSSLALCFITLDMVPILVVSDAERRKTSRSSFKYRGLKKSH